MKKFFLGASLMLFSVFSFGQSVVDNAVIPVSVTLNSILRLTVTSGGNIQFVVNTIADYTSGVANTDLYDTHFVVNSSRDFEVTLGAEDANLIGLETGTLMDLDHLEYEITSGGAGLGNITSTEALTQVPGTTIVTAYAAGGMDYVINWQLGIGHTLLAESYASDIYVTNVFLNLAPQ